MTKYKNQYRIETTRLPTWDYSSSGWYFVTICTKDQSPILGKITNGKMHLSRAGEIVAEEWVRTGTLRPNLYLDEWVVMPNHMHGILIMEGFETSQRDVSTTTFTLKRNSLGSIINQFKGNCTKRIRKSGFPNFAWQPRYYDHIIRNDDSLKKIRRYIQENPLKWEMDEYYLKDP
jgi:putative transposase